LNVVRENLIELPNKYFLLINSESTTESIGDQKPIF